MTDDVVTFEALPLGQAVLWVVLRISWLCCVPTEGFGLLSSTNALSDLSNGTRPGTADLELFLASLGL